MGSTAGGLLLALIGCFLCFLTYRKQDMFWNLLSTRLLRQTLGDATTYILLYLESAVLIVVGILVAMGVLY